MTLWMRRTGEIGGKFGEKKIKKEKNKRKSAEEEKESEDPGSGKRREAKATPQMGSTVFFPLFVIARWRPSKSK
jgi:hypothetical protein